MSRRSYSAGGAPPAALDREPRTRRRFGERRDLPARERLVQRVASEFREMPCLRLTAEQAERLFGLRPDISARIMGTLIHQGVLRRDDDGRYAAVPC
jgi:hypothetical protein